MLLNLRGASRACLCFKGFSSQQQASIIDGGRRSPGEVTGCRFLLSGISWDQLLYKDQDEQEEIRPGEGPLWTVASCLGQGYVCLYVGIKGREKWAQKLFGLISQREKMGDRVGMVRKRVDFIPGEHSKWATKQQQQQPQPQQQSLVPLAIINRLSECWFQGNSNDLLTVRAKYSLTS